LLTGWLRSLQQPHNSNAGLKQCMRHNLVITHHLSCLLAGWLRHLQRTHNSNTRAHQQAHAVSKDITARPPTATPANPHIWITHTTYVSGPQTCNFKCVISTRKLPCFLNPSKNPVKPFREARHVNSIVAWHHTTLSAHQSRPSVCGCMAISVRHAQEHAAHVKVPLKCPCFIPTKKLMPTQNRVRKPLP
jgi:hypothetical protein